MRALLVAMLMVSCGGREIADAIKESQATPTPEATATPTPEPAVIAQPVVETPEPVVAPTITAEDFNALRASALTTCNDCLQKSCQAWASSRGYDPGRARKCNQASYQCSFVRDYSDAELLQVTRQDLCIDYTP